MPDKCDGIESAAGREGLPVDLLKLCKRQGCDAFDGNGRVDLVKLRAYLAEHPDIMAQFDSMPNYGLEKALRERARRKLDELNYERKRGELVLLADVKRAQKRNIVEAKRKFSEAIQTGITEAGLKEGLQPEVWGRIEQNTQQRGREALGALYRGLGEPCTCPKCGEVLA